jgi:hypothetical protein
MEPFYATVPLLLPTPNARKQQIQDFGAVALIIDKKRVWAMPSNSNNILVCITPSY